MNIQIDILLQSPKYGWMFSSGASYQDTGSTQPLTKQPSRPSNGTQRFFWTTRKSTATPCQGPWYWSTHSRLSSSMVWLCLSLWYHRMPPSSHPSICWDSTWSICSSMELRWVRAYFNPLLGYFIFVSILPTALKKANKT